ncbi:hypothetical protein K469DRAFT_591226, partial [Zopfia rhizophila CBS 207.26]
GLAMEYTYDFGDNWYHDFTVIRRAKASPKLECLDGAGHPVGKNVQPDGWEELKKAYRTSETENRRTEEQIHWYGAPCTLHQRRLTGT